jgi:hypothetical protein
MRHWEKRLRTLARRAGFCQIHIARLWCPVCDMRWTGTDAELAEVGDLARRSRGDEARLPTQRCRCGAEAMCLDCAELAHARMPNPTDDPLTPEERQRYDVLIQHVQPRDGSRDARRKAITRA